MKTMFRKMALGTALAATAMSALVATPAAAQGWNGGGYQGGGYHGGGHGGGNGVGIAIAAGVLGLAVGAVLADHSHHRSAPPPVPVTYAPPANCYDGYDGYCYPVEDYYQMGWSWRNGSWWDRDGQRFSHPFMGRGGFDRGGPDGGPRGGYGGEPGRGFDGGRGPDGGPGGWEGGRGGPGAGGGFGGRR